MGWFEDLLGMGGSVGEDGANDLFGLGAGVSGSPDVMSFWGNDSPIFSMEQMPFLTGTTYGNSAPSVDYGSIADFGGGPEVGGNWNYDYAPANVGAGPSLWQQASDFYAPIDKAISSPLGKLGMGGLGALVSYYGANKQNALMKKATEEAAAKRAAALAQHATSTAPVRVTNQRAALPSWGAANRNAFSGNSLAAMTPRTTNTMYAAEGGPARGQGGLCQACGCGGAGYVEGGSAGQDDKIPAMLSDGEYVVDADVVSALGDGNNAAGAKKLDKMRVGIRSHKRSAPATKIPPKAKSPEAYLKGSK